MFRVVEERQEPHHVLALHQLGIDAVQAHRIALAGQHVELSRTVREHDLASLREHHVEVQLVRQAFPQLQRVFEELGVARHQVVGAYQRGVAADIAGSQVSALEHGNIADAMPRRQVVGRGQTMTTATDDDHVVGRLGIRGAPRALPARVGQGPAREREAGIAREKLQVRSPSGIWPAGNPRRGRRRHLTRTRSMLPGRRRAASLKNWRCREKNSMPRRTPSRAPAPSIGRAEFPACSSACPNRLATARASRASTGSGRTSAVRSPPGRCARSPPSGIRGMRLRNPGKLERS